MNGKYFKRKKLNLYHKVSAPFHCSLMKPAAKIMEEKIKKSLFDKPKVKIINNVNAKETDNLMK